MAGRAPRPPILPAGAGRERLALVAARFNEDIVKRLVDGALDALARHGVRPERVDVHWVPGSFELPQAALMLARTGRYDGVVCVGAVVKGQTPHFEYVSGVAAHGISRAALDTGVPISFGVITALTQEQAWDRAGGAVGNRGEEAALAALEMSRLRRELRGPRGRAGRRRAR
jgi:6,7-dimethyl-8-ribityllumazine synthase